MLFKKNYNIGVLLTDSINEFELASVLDTYVRSFPKSINSFSRNGASVSSKYGLTLYPTGDAKDEVNELHILRQNISDMTEQESFTHAQIVNYDSSSNRYPIEQCLERIATLYGSSFKNCVKLIIDYN